MFISEDQNTQTIIKLIQSDSEKLLAVAFIGSGFSNIVNGNVRIICNLTSGATNPIEVKKLLKVSKIKIRNNSKLHAKVYIGTDSLIVGSANLSTNGIALEEESANWIEASIQTTQKEDIKNATIWFNKLWSESDNITEQMLNDAMTLFKKKRNDRPKCSKAIHSLMDRDIYCVIYKEDLTEEGDELAKSVLGENWYDNGYGLYEDWQSLPTGTLIEFRLHNNILFGSKLRYEGVWIYDGYEVKSESNDLSIQIVKEHLPKKDEFFLDQIQTILQKQLVNLWTNYKTEECTLIHINEIIRYK
ncbi:MAG: phospholipase D family protein [Desulfamplus sp.]|nr:phospholipase D family protein [Desulfamplus sp.]